MIIFCLSVSADKWTFHRLRRFQIFWAYCQHPSSGIVEFDHYQRAIMLSALYRHSSTAKLIYGHMKSNRSDYFNVFDHFLIQMIEISSETFDLSQIVEIVYLMIRNGLCRSFTRFFKQNCVDLPTPRPRRAKQPHAPSTDRQHHTPPRHTANTTRIVNTTDTHVPLHTSRTPHTP
jgi:hypothetical protein